MSILRGGTRGTHLGSGRGHRRGLRRVVAGLLLLVLVFGVAMARVIVWPAQGAPSRVDAIIMLAGPGNRISAALRLAGGHEAPVLVVSRGNQGYGGPCPAASAAPGVKIICFDPNPADTRGEAEYAARLARRYGWHSLVLVATPEQDVRARLLFGRCYSGAVYVVTASQPLRQLPYQVAYGLASLFKALVLVRSC